ncbi:MAG TPA: membrane protein insertase YidC [Luteibacter sp.]|jgi:YidC/Oxa1 family membrane protein insertase|nr:membrane protein insertase YidC [Luteibacter sp.]
MNQTRTFLLFALMAVAYFLWTEWENDYNRPPVAQATSAPASANAATPAVPNDGSVPGAPGAPAQAPTSNEQSAQLVTVTTDVLRLTIDTRGGSVVRSELLAFPVDARTKKNPDPPPARLLDDAPLLFFAAQSGLVSNAGIAPDHRTLFHVEKTDYALAAGQDSVAVDLTWADAAGVKVTKRYTLKRGSYVVDVDQRIDNGSGTPWSGNAYEQLQRVAPPKVVGWWKVYTDPAAHSFFGAAWYSPQDKFEALTLTEFEKKPLNRTITGGWAAMIQHYFFVGWIPAPGEAATYTTSIVDAQTATPRYLIRTLGPNINVAPGQSADSTARLYIGPKAQGTLDAIAPGLDLSTNYGWLTVVAQPLHWLLSQLHTITGNWGLAIILLVLLIKAALYKLTDAQFRSGARMRKLQPRVAALKERYGDDKAKMQQAMLELYKKEKVNPMAGCLPILITFPVFLGLYRVLMEAVELRHAPFFGWIHDLSAPDPFYILPAIYVLIQLATMRLTPTAGMDPTQAKMMKVMPLLFAVMFAFFPSGLVLYWIINGATSLAQQSWITRSVDKAEVKAKTT